MPGMQQRLVVKEEPNRVFDQQPFVLTLRLQVETLSSQTVVWWIKDAIFTVS
jgi:hypothetical protein